MSARAWELLLAAWADMDARIAEALPSGRAEGRDAFEARLRALREELLVRVARLGERLGALPIPSDERDQVIEPIAIHLDERVLGRLPPHLGPSWSRIQEELIRTDDGGAVFYQRLDAHLASSRTSPLVLEVYLFCLCEGYFGQYVDEPERVADYKDRLARRLPAPPAPSTTTPAATTTSAPTRVLPPAAYYVGATAVALGSILVMQALAR